MGTNRTAVLGVSCDFHDAAAALLVDGRLVAAAEQERFSRRKHDRRLPVDAIRWALDHGAVGPGDLEAVAFYEKPLSSFERILVTHGHVGPRGAGALADAVSSWSRSKAWIGYRLERILAETGLAARQVVFLEHHQSHAASAFYPSPFEHAAILTIDGVGEWSTASYGVGRGRKIAISEEMGFPDSVGLFYSAMTSHCGFDVNDGEYKLMGLAPYGSPRYVEALRENVIRIFDDGSVRLDQRWFDYRAGRRMGSRRLDQLLDGPPRDTSAPLSEREADIACSAQIILEEVVLAMARHVHRQTGESALCTAGGVALNCAANRRLREDGPFDSVWVQPAAGDSGGAIGAAMWTWHQILENDRDAPDRDAMNGCLLGPSFDRDEVNDWIVQTSIPFVEIRDPVRLCEVVARELADGSIVGWFQGRMEFGPRALGSRSILADPRDEQMVERLNRLIKNRESFRPFAPAVLAEKASEWFDMDGPSPHMMFTVGVGRSDLPACTHVDNSARVQTVERSRSPEFHRLIEAFDALTGVPVLVNTSFNRNSEPIVRTPADALRCFAKAGLDLLVIGSHVIRSVDLPVESRAALVGS